MSCGFLYEIRRKSEDFEQQFEQNNRENSSLSDLSKDEEIWEVPEESFDHVYHQMGHNEEEENITNNIDTLPEVYHLEQFEDTKKLHISLSAEKISLKSLNLQSESSSKTTRNDFQTINKSLHMEADIKKSMTNDSITTTVNTNIYNAGVSKVQWKNDKLFNNNTNSSSSSSSLLNFTIVPINISSQVQQQQEDHKTFEKFPEIKLTSFSTKRPTFKRHSGKTTVFKPLSSGYGQAMDDLKMPSVVKQSKFTFGSEANKHITESSTSPESLLDNILSNASSVSMQSSSPGSNDANVDLDSRKLKHDEKVRDSSFVKFKTGILKPQIPQLKIITAPDLPINHKQHVNNKETYLSHSLLTTSNSDSFETASNQTRSVSTSPLCNISPKVPTEVALYPDDLRCKLCNELFKDPRSLNCLHSFCFQCIVNENFKQDASIPFSSQPQSIQAPSVASPQKQMEEQDCKDPDSD